MTRSVRVLFTCVGRRVILIRSFRQAARQLGLKCTIIGTDTTENSSALQSCDKKILVRPVSDNGYFADISKIIRQEGINLLVPTVDLDLLLLAEKRKNLARQGCTALVSNPEIIKICQDKRLMYQFLVDHNFDTPWSLTAREALAQRRLTYPVFCKPWDGYASKGNAIAHDREELKFYAGHVKNCMVQELVRGEEYTVDVLVDQAGRVRCAVPRLRLETRGGEVTKGMTVKHPLIIEKSKELIETLGGGPGVLTIQGFLTSAGKVRFTEINPRFGGGVPLSIKAGANFPKWILQFWLGQDPVIGLTRWRDGLVMLRYDDAVWRQVASKN